MIVCDVSVVGNIRPSLSVLSCTPRCSKPRHGVAGGKLFERRDQFMFATGITPREFACVKARVRDVATAAAEIFHLGKKARVFSRMKISASPLVSAQDSAAKNPPLRRR